MKMLTPWGLLLVIALGAGLSRAETTATPEQEATLRTEAWLALVDKGEYAESWKAAASFFRGAVTAEKWKEAVAAARIPLGRVVSRKLKSRKSMEQLPGAPDGKYVVIQFDTVFEKKARAVETVTPMLDDGEWRVSGYFIQ